MAVVVDSTRRPMAGQRNAAPRVVQLAREPRYEKLDRRLLGLAGVMVAYAVSLTVVTVAHPFHGLSFLAVTDIAGVIPPFVAALLALIAADRADDEAHVGWLLIGLGCLFWGMGEATWTFYEVVLGREVPFPSAADVGYLAMLPPTALGVIFFSSEGRRLANSRSTLDGAAFVLAFAAAVWYLVLYPTYAESDAGVLEKAIAGAYPLGDVVLAYALVVAARRQWRSQDRTVLATLLGGVILLIGADVGFAYLTLSDRYSATSLVNLGWPFSFLLIAWAAALSVSWRPRFVQEEDPGAAHHWTQSLPIGLVPGMLLLDVVAWRGAPLGANIPLWIMTGLVITAVLLRQFISVGLWEELEHSRDALFTWFDNGRRAA